MNTVYLENALYAMFAALIAGFAMIISAVKNVVFPITVKRQFISPKF